MCVQTAQPKVRTAESVAGFSDMSPEMQAKIRAALEKAAAASSASSSAASSSSSSATAAAAGEGVRAVPRNTVEEFMSITDGQILINYGKVLIKVRAVQQRRQRQQHPHGRSSPGRAMRAAPRRRLWPQACAASLCTAPLAVPPRTRWPHSLAVARDSIAMSCLRSYRAMSPTHAGSLVFSR